MLRSLVFVLLAIFAGCAQALVVEWARYGTGNVTVLSSTWNAAYMVSIGSDQQVTLWNAATGLGIAQFSENRMSQYVSVSPDRQRVATAKANDTVLIYDVSTGTVIKTLSIAGGPVAFSPDGSLLAAALHTGAVHLYSTSTYSLARTLTGSTQAQRAMEFSPDGQRLAVGGVDKKLRIYMVGTGVLEHYDGDHGSFINAVSFAPDGNEVISTSDDFVARSWSVNPWTPATASILSDVRAPGARFSGDGQRIVTQSNSGTIIVRGRSNGQVERTIAGPVGVAGTCIPGTSTYVAAISPQIRFVDVKTGSDQTTEIVPGGTMAWLRPKISELRWNNSTGFLDLSMTDGASIRSGQFSTSIASARMVTRETGMVVGASSVQNSFYATGTSNRLYYFTGDIGTWIRYDVSDDDRTYAQLATTKAGVYDVPNQAVRCLIDPLPSTASDMRLSHDGKRMAISFSNMVRLYDTSSGAVIQTLYGNTTGLSGLAFSLGDSYLVGADSTGKYYSWDVTTGALLGSWQIHNGFVARAEVNPVTGSVASIGSDGKLQVWKSENGQILGTAQPVSQWQALYFEPNGARLVTIGNGSVICYRDPSSRSILVDLDLKDLGPDSMTRIVDYEVRSSAGSKLFTGQVKRFGNNQRLQPILVPNTNQDIVLWLKASHWLAATVPYANASSDSTVVVASLVNGDIDGDNVVSLFDYLELSAAFDTSAGDTGFNKDADLDGDQQVGLFDYLILSDNFDRTGAP